MSNDSIAPPTPKTQVKDLSDSPTRWQIYAAADPTVERIIPSLAKEIGLNESIVLMQLAFWISNSKNVRENTYWTYNSLRDMQRDYFSYWGVETLRRTIKNLQKKGYILVRHFNKRKGDNTQWFALVPDKLSALTSILILPVVEAERPDLSQNETPPATLSQNETPTQQNETTLPETSTDIKESSVPVNGTSKSVKSKKTMPKEIFDPMADAVIAVFGWSWDTASKNEKSRVRAAAKQLCEANRTPDEVPLFYAECKRRKWTNISPLALCSVVSDVAKRQTAKIIPLDIDPADLPRTDDYIDLAGGA